MDYYGPAAQREQYFRNRGMNPDGSPLGSAPAVNQPAPVMAREPVPSAAPSSTSPVPQAPSIYPAGTQFGRPDTDPQRQYMGQPASRPMPMQTQPPMRQTSSPGRYGQQQPSGPPSMAVSERGRFNSPPQEPMQDRRSQIMPPPGRQSRQPQPQLSPGVPQRQNRRTTPSAG
jgi:hypothetical protein